MKIAILGCGWLGMPLAKTLVEKGFEVKGSVTSRDKLNNLSQEGITPYMIKLLPEGVQGDLTSFLSDIDKLIIAIPPGLRKDPYANHVAKIGRLVNYIEKSGVAKIIYISSTGVFEDTEDFTIYTESSVPNNSTDRGKQLIGAENTIKSSEAFQTTIIRFGGLIGPGRHPVNYLSNRKNISDPKAPVNLIHQQDCKGLIKAVLDSEYNSEIINAVYPEHPSKEEYYSKLAEIRNLAIPEFDHSSPSKGKKVSSEVVQKELKYEFIRDIWK